MSISANIMANSKETDKEELKESFKKMVNEISNLTQLSNKSISIENQFLAPSFEWLNKYISNSETLEIVNAEDYRQNFNSIFNYITSIYNDNNCDKNLLISLSQSLNLLKTIDKIISQYNNYKKHHSELLQSFIYRIDENLEKTINTEQKIEKLQEGMNHVLDTTTSEFNNRISALYSDLNKKVDEQISTLKKEVNQEVNSFSELKSKLSKQVQLYSSATLADQNRVQAEEESKTANILRIIGGLWLFLVSGISFYFFYDLLNTNKTSEISVLIFRWMSVLLMTIPGIYILRESSIHRADARNYRRLAIQLATIDSYLESFEKEEKIEVKRSLISNFFSSDETKTDFSSVPDLLKSFENVQDTILSIASKQPSQKANSDKEDVTPEK